MRADLGAQIAVSLLAHLSVFFTVNKFLNSADIPNLDLSINTTYVSESSVGIMWSVHSTDGTEISSVQNSIFNDGSTAMTQSSPVLRNATSGSYRFFNLQPATLYNACLITFTKEKNIHLTKCVNVKTESSGFSRLKLLAPSDNIDLTIFLCLLVIGVFIAVVAAYNMYMQSIRARKVSQYRSKRQQQGMFDEAYDTDAGTSEKDLKIPLLAEEDEFA